MASWIDDYHLSVEGKQIVRERMHFLATASLLVVDEVGYLPIG
jgi:hypothetical protein